MLVASGIIPPSIATVASVSAAASLAGSSAQNRPPAEIKEENAENGRAGTDSQEEQVDVVKTDQPAPQSQQPVTRKRKLVDLDANRLESKPQETKPYQELASYSKRIKFDALTNQSYDNQFLSTSSNRTNADYPANLCYS